MIATESPPRLEGSFTAGSQVSTLDTKSTTPPMGATKPEPIGQKMSVAG